MMQTLATPTPRGLPLPDRRAVLTLSLVGLLGWALLTLPETLAMPGRIALLAMVLAMLGWVLTRLPESLVALAVVLGLVLSGVLSEAQLFEALGSELVWLLLAAFVIATVIRDSGLTQRLVAPLLRRQPRFAPFALTLTLLIAATAFVLPSTSGRAALLLPVYVALAQVLPDARLRRPLALIFPTAILLSAGGSLIGAGAHLLAAESIRVTTGLQLGYAAWAMLGMPFGLISSLVGTILILLIFVPRELYAARLGVTVPEPVAAELRVRQRRIALVLGIIVGLWLTADLHGIGMAATALIGALVLLTPPFTSRKSKEIFRSVDVELLLYMTATVLMAQAMTATGADRWLAGLALQVLPARLHGSLPAVVALLAGVSVAAHLFVTSRSARAAVLIPAVALPLAGLGHDAALMILIAVMGTGFCQTMMASAKPVAIFAGAESEGSGFTQADLFRLALPLAPLTGALLIGFALTIWPAQLAQMRGGAAPQPAAQVVPMPVVAAPAPSAFEAIRPPKRPADLLAQHPVHAAPAPRKARGGARPEKALRQMQAKVNRSLRPAGIRIILR
ncbi:SLC13 family permease [Paracoccus lutimaris]|uniref:Di/tricarboxylate transporter n=1 Tax=Paracoccus lutimaris TaxID=1490030 RepID=A0A368Z7K2_9RHOB|nr:SLC13 family permease [Paracoccus lutimaris]RCW87137.1 di/tricarboxylate transporter [Paracoccus lutimaris]